MTSLFSTLGFDFDTTKFGSALYLSPQAEAYLNAAPLQISSWQTSDLANGNIQVSNYYKNPTNDVCANLTSSATTMLNWAPMHDIANNFLYASEAATRLQSNLTNLIVEIANFKSHTDNVSGSVVMTSNTDTIPSLDFSTSIGNQLLRIVNTTDGVTNTSPLLGSMTSLFIVDDMTTNNATLQSDMVTLTNSVVGSNSNISYSAMNAIVSHVESMNTYISTRRTSDWSFYARSVQIIKDYNVLSRFDTMGNTQLYLVNNLIGTDRLVNNLANTA